MKGKGLAECDETSSTLYPNTYDRAGVLEIRIRAKGKNRILRPGPPTEGRPAVGRAANVASMADIQASGVDAALSAMSLGGGGGDDDKHPEKRMKAAYKAYEEKMMPEMKQQYPGLKRQQYLDKIFSSWKKSPENPMNQL